MHILRDSCKLTLILVNFSLGKLIPFTPLPMLVFHETVPSSLLLSSINYYFFESGLYEIIHDIFTLIVWVTLFKYTVQ